MPAEIIFSHTQVSTSVLMHHTLTNTKEINHIWEYAQEMKAKGASPLFQLVQLIWNLFYKNLGTKTQYLGIQMTE